MKPPACCFPSCLPMPALEPHIESLVAALFTVLAAVAIQKASVKAPRDVRPPVPETSGLTPRPACRN